MEILLAGSKKGYTGPGPDSFFHFDTDTSEARGRTVSVTGSVAIVPSAKFGAGALQAVNASASVTAALSGLDVSQAFTLECFLRRRVVDGANSNQYMLAILTSANTGIGIQIFNNGARVYDAAGGSAKLIVGSFIPNDTVYRHVALSVDASNVWRLFLNGNQVGTFNSANKIPNGSLAKFCVAGIPGSSLGLLDYFIDEPALTAGIAKYTGNFTPPTAPF